MIQYIKSFVVKLDDNLKVIKGLLYLKLLELNVKITNNDLNVLVLFVYEQDIKKVADEAILKGYKLSLRSVENTISDLVEAGLLVKLDIGKRAISTNILPTINAETLAIDCKIHNIGT